MKHPDVVSIVIQTVNSAFDGEVWRNEVAFILSGVAQRIRDEDDYLEGVVQLHDTNGNRVGNVIAGNTPGDSYKFIDAPKGRKTKSTPH